MMRLFSVTILFLLIFNLAFVPNPAFSEQFNTVTINGFDDKPFFKIEIANKGTQVEYGGETWISEFNLNEQHIGALKKGMEYWVTVLNKHSNPFETPKIYLHTIARRSDDAEAISIDSRYDSGRTELGDMLLGIEKYTDPVARIKLEQATYFEGTWYTGDMASLPMNSDKSDLPSTFLHEMGHALGLSASADDYDTFYANLSLWTQGLINEHEESPQKSQEIEDFLSDNNENKGAGVYFTGKYVADVLNGAKLGYSDDISRIRMPGIPVHGWEKKGPDLSHMELQNSLMSHQDYRNWNIYMEAELAVMQDIGYNIDRRNFFGHSVYNSDMSLINSNPYFARNSEGTAFVDGEYNSTPWGMGLHVYGSNNTITQAANVLSSGTWGIGIRVDGSKNSLTINPDTLVHANGLGGNALAVTYGNSHNIIHRGDLKAQGQRGTAARFDFGSNSLGNRGEYRGSWLSIDWSSTDDTGKYKRKHDKLTKLPSALKGSLIDSFDVSGSLEGSYAAIYIADNALVKNINIMNGASISGDIISEWDPACGLLNYDTDKQENLLTKITFGRKANADGDSTNATDNDFSLNYTDNILGKESMLMSVEGGKLTFNGMAKLYSVMVKEKATLSGTGRYEVGLDDKSYAGIDRSFINEGTLLTYNPANLLDMSGLYIEARDFDSTKAKLGVIVNAKGAIGGLTLAGDAANKDETFAQLLIIPAKDCYSDSVIIDLKSAVKGAGNVTYTDTNIELIDGFESPTLDFAISGKSTDGSVQLIITRNEDAYTQHSYCDDSEDATSMLHQIATSPDISNRDMEPFLETIDFSDESTFPTALEQLSSTHVKTLENWH